MPRSLKPETSQSLQSTIKGHWLVSKESMRMSTTLNQKNATSNQRLPGNIEILKFANIADGQTALDEIALHVAKSGITVVAITILKEPVSRRNTTPSTEREP
ncbi:hypothetical protein ACFFRR_005422 [Megaselia abdita]